MDRFDDLRPSRRDWLAWSLGGLAAAGWTPRRGLADEDASRVLIVRNARPLDAETPVEVFQQYRTPNSQFFVRSHFGAPAVGLRPWTIEVGGVRRPRTFGIGELQSQFPTVRRAAVLQCSGNGRSYFRPGVAGVAWERGAVGNAEWEGVRLADVLEHCGTGDGRGHVHLEGADGPPMPRTPSWLRSIPLERALDPGTLIAFRMNGEPLPPLHGGPARLVVPGWTGNHWMKWLRRIALGEHEADGFYQRTGYRMPRRPMPPGATIPPDELEPVTWLNVKSLIASPTGPIEPGPLEIRGVAWTGRGRVARVEVEIDGAWQPAELHGPDQEGAWRLWRHTWQATPGRHVLRARATDSLGQSQPDETPWNKSGYLWNGIESRTIEVAPHA
jgi:DMSO/TMAO reductase YedYZ molybdopterin-dependent catalytic subunit